MLEQALVDGICAEGGQPAIVGIVPTPAVALITREMGADCGIVISASHNPPEYDGIKFFDGEGYKLPMRWRTMQELVEELRGERVEPDSTHPCQYRPSTMPTMRLRCCRSAASTFPA